MMRITAAAVVAAASSVACADTVNMAFAGTGQGRNISVSLSGGGPGGVFAGQLKHSFSGGTGSAAILNGQTLVTFCTEITQYVTSSGAPYTIMPLSSLPTPGAGMGLGKQQAMWDLYSYAAGSQFGSTADQDYAAAFQMAIWEIAYDNESAMSLTGGNLVFGGLTAATQTYFNAFVLHIDGSGTGAGIMGLGNPTYQDQIVVVPLPHAAMLGMAGLGLAFAARMRRRG